MPSQVTRLIPLFLFVALAACSQQAEEPGASAPPVQGGTDEKPAADDTAAQTIARTPSPAGARVFFVSPADGATVTNPVTIEFGIEGMTVVRAGVDAEFSGHHHLIVDAGLPPLDAPIPASDNYIHFGDASTSTTLNLEPGEHTLQLILGDHLHFPHDPPVHSEVIRIKVE